MALNDLLCADVLLRTYTLTHSLMQQIRGCTTVHCIYTVSQGEMATLYGWGGQLYKLLTWNFLRI